MATASELLCHIDASRNKLECKSNNTTKQRIRTVQADQGPYRTGFIAPWYHCFRHTGEGSTFLECPQNRI